MNDYIKSAAAVFKDIDNFYVDKHTPFPIFAKVCDYEGEYHRDETPEQLAIFILLVGHAEGAI